MIFELMLITYVITLRFFFSNSVYTIIKERLLIGVNTTERSKNRRLQSWTESETRRRLNGEKKNRRNRCWPNGSEEKRTADRKVWALAEIRSVREEQVSLECPVIVRLFFSFVQTKLVSLFFPAHIRLYKSSDIVILISINSVISGEAILS